MSLAPSTAGGHYDGKGEWVQTKHCFAYCGPERCNCQPPGNRHYDPVRDQALQFPVSGDVQLELAQHNPALLGVLQRCPWDHWKPSRTIS